MYCSGEHIEYSCDIEKREEYISSPKMKNKMFKPKFKIIYCKDCDKQLSLFACYHNSIRCDSCARKLQFKDPKNHPMFGKKGDKHPLFKEGKERFCLDCNKKLNIHANVAGNVRCLSCARKEQFRLHPETNALWQGGISYEPYTSEFVNSLKEKIRNRDHRNCQVCNKNEIELNRKLDVHHIDYNKQNCNEENLISLCQDCHRKTNGNRDFWFAYFTEIINSLLVS
jgi:ribosomal protein S27E